MTKAPIDLLYSIEQELWRSNFTVLDFVDYLKFSRFLEDYEKSLDTNKNYDSLECTVE